METKQKLLEIALELRPIPKRYWLEDNDKNGMYDAWGDLNTPYVYDEYEDERVFEGTQEETLIEYERLEKEHEADHKDELMVFVDRILEVTLGRKQ